MTTEVAKQAEGESPFRGIVPDRSVEQMQSDVEEGLKYLASVAAGNSEPNRDRIRAIEVLMDRYYGKPTQRRDTESKGGSTQNIERQLNFVIAGDHKETVNELASIITERLAPDVARGNDRMPRGGDQGPRRPEGERGLPPGTAGKGG